MKRLQDIADQVGVSRTTVSNVLHGNTKKVSKEMIRKISEILNQEGYVPNTSSRELTRKGSCIIGLVLGYNCVHGIPSLRDTFVAELLSGVEETAHRNGYYVMLINGHDQNTDRMAEIASRWNVDGLVVLGLDEQKYKELRRQLNKYMVLIDTYPEAEYHYVNVGTDDFGGGAMIAKYLLGLTAEKSAIFFSPRIFLCAVSCTATIWIALSRLGLWPWPLTMMRRK